MPSKSPKQARTMRAAAHDAGFASKVGIPQGVARDFTSADQALKKRRSLGKSRLRSHARSLTKRR